MKQREIVAAYAPYRTLLKKHVADVRVIPGQMHQGKKEDTFEGARAPISM